MIRVGGRGVVRLVARIALRGHRLELAVRSTLVTGIAVDRGMRSGEREAVIVLLNLLHRDLPSADSVTLFAVGSQLPPVNIGVAVLAALPHVGEDRLHVALNAGDGLMHTAQRVARLVVIEFRNGSDRLPGVGRMAILARDIQVAMWAVRAFIGLGFPGGAGKNQQQYCKKFEYAPRPEHDRPSPVPVNRS